MYGVWNTEEQPQWPQIPHFHISTFPPPRRDDAMSMQGRHLLQAIVIPPMMICVGAGMGGSNVLVPEAATALAWKVKFSGIEEYG